MYFDVKACGRRIQSLRDSLGYSQDEFSEKIHIGRTHLAKIEIGIRSPSIDALVEIASICDVSLDYLVLGANIKSGEISSHLRQAQHELKAIEMLLV